MPGSTRDAHLPRAGSPRVALSGPSRIIAMNIGESGESTSPPDPIRFRGTAPAAIHLVMERGPREQQQNVTVLYLAAVAIILAAVVALLLG